MQSKHEIYGIATDGDGRLCRADFWSVLEMQVAGRKLAELALKDQEGAANAITELLHSARASCRQHNYEHWQRLAKYRDLMLKHYEIVKGLMRRGDALYDEFAPPQGPLASEPWPDEERDFAVIEPETDAEPDL